MLLASSSFAPVMEVEQFRVGHMQNFSYLLYSGKEAAVVDPSFDIRRVMERAEELGLRVNYVLLTHHHFDHIMEAENLAHRSGAKIVAFRDSIAGHDIAVEDGSILKLGEEEIKVMHTPGHTADSVCYLIPDGVFTGDTLFVGECGRVDLEDSSPEDMYESLLVKLYGLPDSTIVFPGHDYGPTPTSTIGNEKKNNYTMKKRTREEFLNFIRS